MKINKISGFLVLTLFVVNPSQAGHSLIIIDWGATNADSSSVSYIGNYDKEIRTIEAIVSHSNIGNQRFYIDLSLNNGNICENYLPTTDTVVFSGQAVKMIRSCNKYNNVDQNYYSYTPYTDKGHKYIVDLFKKSTTPIKVTIDGDKVDIPVKGFTKVWNSFGGDAI
jgi:hypothetical protein